MYRALPVSRQVVSSSGRGKVRLIRRRIATESTPITPKKKSVLRRLFWITTTATGTFYVGSAFLSFNNQIYYDFFSERVPLGQPMLEFAEARKWDNITAHDVVEAGKRVYVSTHKFIADTINGTPSAEQAKQAMEKTKQAVEKQTEVMKANAKKVVQDPKARVEPVVTRATAEMKEDVSKFVHNVVKTQIQQASEGLSELIQRAEAAIAGKPYPIDSTATALPDLVPPVTFTNETPSESPASTTDEADIYASPLPLGFEPPPGYKRPSSPKKAKTEETNSPGLQLPLIAPAVSSSSVSEPIISHLAGTIDSLASFIASNPSAASKAPDILKTAKEDLTALAERFEKAKEDEKATLETRLDEQTREYTLKLMELEMQAQDRLDSQEEDFRQFFEQERAKIIQAYREKLDQELKTQTELINERLKEEVIAQGIELQRRWIREVKVRVEQERGGRLAKLDELAANLKRLERVAIDNSNYLDENIRIHAFWSSIRALTSAALTSPVRKPFREELRVLRHVATAREDPVVAVVLETLEGTDVPDIGVEPFADLASWFTSEVAPKVVQVALVPDQNAGLLSYLTSRFLSGLRFKRSGLVEGDDVLSVLARAEHHLNEKNLDNATRELNQLKGPAQSLLRDWLQAARRRLEVQQALEVVETQATLASLLVL